MFKTNILIGAVIIVASWGVSAATIVHYDIDFSSPTHTVGSLPTTGSSINTVSSIFAGQPTVDSSFGSLTNQPLVFDSATNYYEQIKLDMRRGYDNYNVSFDIETAALNDSLYNFSIYFDTPLVQTLYFHGNAGVNVFDATPIPPAGGGYIGDFSDNTLMHVDIGIDLISNLWTINTNSLPAYTGVFYAEDYDINTIRFSLSPWKGGADLDPAIHVGLDNILVSSTVVPLPASIWLFGSGLIGVISLTTRRKNR